MIQEGLEFDSRIDKELLSAKIVEVCGAMTPVHNTTDSYMAFHRLFFRMRGKQISDLLDTTEYEYEPLENYRRKEDLKHTADEVTDTSESIDEASESNQNISSSSTVENKTSAYNESAYQPENQEIDEGRVTTGNDTSSNSDRKYNQKRDFDTVDDNIVRGLNGLYTTQQLIQQQRDVVQFNVYEWIVNKYMEELFICVF